MVAARLRHGRGADARRAAEACGLLGAERFREPEVEHLHLAVGRELHVRGFEIAVHDAFFVRRLERVRDLARDLDRLGHGDRPADQPIRERRSLDELELEERHAVDVLHAVDRRDMRMIQRREQHRFLLEACEPVGLLRELRRQHLDRDLAPELGVERAVHLAHAPGPEKAEDLEMC